MVVTVQIESSYATSLRKSAFQGGSQSLASAIANSLGSSSTNSESESVEENRGHSKTEEDSQKLGGGAGVPFSREPFPPSSRPPPFSLLNPNKAGGFVAPTSPSSIAIATTPAPATVAIPFEASDTNATSSQRKEFIKQLASLFPLVNHRVISIRPPIIFTPLPTPEASSTAAITAGTTRKPSDAGHLAPVFTTPFVKIHVPENEANVELVTLEARYSDRRSGPIHYIMETGDESLFRHFLTLLMKVL